MSYKQFALAAIAAVAYADNHYEQVEVEIDNGMYGLWSASKSFSRADFTGPTVRVYDNNSLFLQIDKTDAVAATYMPYIRGGSIEYDVQLDKTDSGCVAGVYLLEAKEGRCSDNPQTSGNLPQCRSIDVMQANRYGFETQAHPCSNGTCDALSQCAYGMQNQGLEKYGQDAYGPSGSLINTDKEFHVKSEFVSTPDYKKLWKLRTTLSQDGRTIEMEADCRDYLVGLNDAIEGGMGIIYSSWDNTDATNSFELDYGQTSDGSCEGVSHEIKNLKINQMGAVEDMDPDSKPVFAEFEAYADVYGGQWDMYAYGLQGRELSSAGDSVTIGENNRAWILDYKKDDSTYWSYWHDYLGGSFEYTVDLSAVDCACSAGMYLMQADDESCSWNPKESGVSPQCSRVELMEANINGFKVQSFPCEFDQCPEGSDTTEFVDTDEYGPGANYKIDSTQPFTVKTHFYATADSEGKPQDLARIETCLVQGDNKITIVQDESDYLYTLSQKLQYRMASIMSNFDAGTTNELSGQCANACSGGATKYSNLRWTSGDSIVQPDADPELVIEKVADSLAECGEDSCSACHIAHMSDKPDEKMAVCTDYTVYKFSNLCGRRQNQDKCGAGDICVRSWPHSDPNKWRSDDFACRPLPGRLIDNEFTFARRSTSNMNKGLCKLGCDGTCHNSWPVGDPERWKSADAIFRCKN